MPELANHSANSWLFPASPTTGRASCSDKTALGQLSFGRLVLPCLPIYLVTRMRRQVWTCHSITLPAWNAASNTISDQTPRPLPIVCLCPFLPESVKIMFSLFIIKQMLICFNLWVVFDLQASSSIGGGFMKAKVGAWWWWWSPLS